jgi:pimeloyl-ACP methyl ester carboxylesterase
MGGSIATLATSIYPDIFEHLILLDSMIVIPPNVAERMSSNRPSARLVVASPDLETAVGRFRLTPSQPCKDYVLKHVAENSYTERSDGWYLKSDPLIPNTYKYNDLHDAFTKMNCPFDYVYGQASQLVTQEVLEYMTYVGNVDEKKIHVLAGAMHHLFLDMPEEFISLIKKLITK